MKIYLPCLLAIGAAKSTRAEQLPTDPERRSLRSSSLAPDAPPNFTLDSSISMEVTSHVAAKNSPKDGNTVADILAKDSDLYVAQLIRDRKQTNAKLHLRRTVKVTDTIEGGILDFLREDDADNGASMSMASSGIASMSMDHVIPPSEVIAYWAEKESSKLGKSAKFVSSDQAGVVEVENLTEEQSDGSPKPANSKDGSTKSESWAGWSDGSTKSGKSRESTKSGKAANNYFGKSAKSTAGSKSTKSSSAKSRSEWSGGLTTTTSSTITTSFVPPAEPGQPKPIGGRRAGVYGDPHISTFDRLRFECQAAGEFVTVTSLEDPSFQIQERFTAIPPSSDVCSHVSVSTGVAIVDREVPTIQISTPRSNRNGTAVLNMVGGCPIDFYVDGQAQTFDTDIGSKVNVSVSGSDIRILHTESLVCIDISTRDSGSFGCHFTTQVFLPYVYRKDEIVGLFGTPNGNRKDDWITPDGTILSEPSAYESIFGPSYDYCVTNWCIKDSRDSIFTYSDEEEFDEINLCDANYTSQLDMALAGLDPSEELVNICDKNVICLVDGLCGSPTDALTALNDEMTIISGQDSYGSSSPTFSRTPSISPSLSTSPSISTSPSGQPSSSIYPSTSPSTSNSPSVKPSSSISPSAGPTIPCRGPCDDGNLCTNDYCDISSQKCKSEPVVCGENEACDAFTGDCEDVQVVVPCVAVIDEWDNRNYDAEWSDFRSQYPKRPFCLLIPGTRSGSTRLPAGFINDTVNNPDGIDRTVVSNVNRDDGNPTMTSDWFAECGLSLYGTESIDFIGLFIDVSGSMTFSTVRESAKEFTRDMECAGKSIDLVFDGSERWIRPFFTSLKPPTGSTECGSYNELCNSGVCQGGVCVKGELNCPSEPSISPSMSALPSLAPSKTPSITPSISSYPSSQPSKGPSMNPSASPSFSGRPSESIMPTRDLPSAPPSIHPSQEPTQSKGPTETPSLTPSKSLKPSVYPSNVPSGSSKPSDAITSTPSSIPSERPSESIKPTRTPQAIAIKLTTGAITAGDSISVFAVLEESGSDPIVLLPSDVLFALTFVEAEANGTVPVLTTTTDVNIETFLDTRGVYSITATTIQDGQSLSTNENFVVLPPAAQSEMDRLYAELSAAVNGVNEGIAVLERAVDNNDTSSIQDALNDLRGQRDTIDLEELSTTSVFAPEEGFLPTPGQLSAAGYFATSDDTSLRSLLKDLTANFINMGNALESGQDQSVLETLNQQASSLLEQIDSLNPTVHGWVMARNHLNYLFAVGIPQVVHSEVDALEREILEENIGVTRRLGERKLFGFVSIMGAASIRAKIMDKVYMPFLVEIAKQAAILAAANLLQSALGASSGLQPLTGGSLSFHVFERKPSYLEVIGANPDYPSRTRVVLVGMKNLDAGISAIQAAVGAAKVKNLSEVREALKGLKEAAEGIDSAARTSLHTASSFGFPFLLGGVSLRFDDGFEDVNSCGTFFCLPQPVIMLATNLDSGGAALGVFLFIKT